MAQLRPDVISTTVDVNVKKAQEQIHSLEQDIRHLRDNNKSLREEMARLARTEGDHSQEIAKLDEQIRNNSKTIRSHQREIKTLEGTIGLSGKTAAQLKKELKSLQRELDNTSRRADPQRYAELSQRIEDTRRAFYEATGQTEKLGKSFFSLKGMTAQLKMGFVALVGMITGYFLSAIRSAVSTIIDFESANSKLAGVLGTTKKGVWELTKEAKRLGSTTSFTASQVTQLQTELAKLGFNQGQIKEMEESVLKFAQSVGTDLASAASFAGASMRIFGLEAKDVEDMLASLAIGTTKSALDFSYLQNAMATIGPVANAFSFNIRDVIALLGNLANAGFDASSAATATRNIILNLADSQGKLAQALGKPVTNLNELVEGLNKLNAEGIDLNKALELTDKRSVAAFSKFLAASEQVTELRDNVTGCTGAFNAMYEEMSDNVETSLAGLSSAVEGVILKFYDSRGILKSIVDLGIKMVNGVGQLIDFLGKYSGAILMAVKAFIAYKTAVLATSVAVKAHSLALAANNALAVKSRISTLALSGVTNLLSLNLDKAAKAFRLLGTAIKLNPIGLAISAVTLLLPLLDKFRKKTEDVTAAQRAQKAALESAGEEYGKEKSRIMSLIAVAKEEQISLDRRKQAIEELNKIIPGYNAKIDETTGKYSAANGVLETYLENLEKEIRYKANMAELERLTAEAEKARMNKDRTIEEQNERVAALPEKPREYSAPKNVLQSGSTTIQFWRQNEDEKAKIRKTKADAERLKNEATEAWKEAEQNVEKMRSFIEKGIKDASLSIPAAAESAVASTVAASTAIDEKAAKKRAKEAEKAQKEAEREAERLRKEEEKTRKEAIKSEENDHNSRLEATDAFYRKQQEVITEHIQKGEISEEAASLYLLEMEKQNHEDRLAELRRYYDQVESDDKRTEEERVKELQSLEKQMSQSRMKILNATGQWSEKMHSLSVNAASPEGMKEALDRQIRSIEDLYAIAISRAEQNGDDTVVLEEEKARRIDALRYAHLQELYRLQELTGLSWEDEYARELASLENMHRQGLISEKAYQNKRTQLQIDNVKKYYDYFQKTSSSMFSAIQEAEIAKSDAKYDVLIQQAKNNGEDTAALEEEKENKKLEIQKKYADVDFAIKISEIVANTAVAIMTAYKQLGPIAGSIAAGMLTATGVAQAATAKAERDKIKNMQPGKTSSSSAETPTATRQLTGFSEGGYTGDGGRYEIAGVVHKGEYVVPMPIMRDPRVLDAVSTIEAIRMHNSLNSGLVTAQAVRGYSDGGFTSGSSEGPTDHIPDAGNMKSAIKELTGTLSLLESRLKRLRAYVVYRDIEEAAEKYEESISPFTRNRKDA